jgi:signal transduction histidine kinase
VTRRLRMRTERRPTTFEVDALVAASLCVLMAVELATVSGHRGPIALNVLGAVAFAVPLAFRRRAPLPALTAFMVVAVVQTALLTSVTTTSSVLGSLLLMAYANGSRGAPGRAGWVAPGLCVAGVIGVDVGAHTLDLGDVLFPGGMAVASWYSGRVVARRTLLAAELHEEALRAQERRDHDERRAVTDERRRIAREMHDVVAHSVSVMVVQAGGARRILDSDPERAAAAAGEIERAGREAMGEMRRLLGMLRPGDDVVPVERGPQPTLDDVGALVARARDAGLPVALRVEGEPRPLPLGMELAAYRILQEGVTNALRHAHGSDTVVRIAWSPGDLELEVTDHGPGPGRPGPRAGDTGHGLIGMRERVRLYGGELETGRRRGGGFRVLARLPFEPAEELAPLGAPAGVAA